MSIKSAPGRPNAAVPAKRLNGRVREGIAGYCFMIPTLIGISIFIFYPLIADIVYSFTDWNGLTAPNFIGFENYYKLFFTDTLFLKSIFCTFYYSILCVPTGLAGGLLLAMLLNKQIRGIKMFRTIFYLPCVLPAVASLVVFKYFFSATNYGVANQILLLFGLPTGKWLFGESSVMPTLMLVNLWGVGAGMVVFLAGLQSVPAEIYEAANLDGARGFRKFWSITLPMISPIMVLQLITGLIAALQVINPALLITQGGPNNATYFINYNIYRSAFEFNQYGKATAESLILLVIITAITIPVFKITDQYAYYEASGD